MPYRFRRRETVLAGVRRIAREQVDDALAAARAVNSHPHDAVHEVRQRCKKVRGLLRLVRSRMTTGYRKENAFFRDAAAGLSHLRDAQSMVVCFDRLCACFPDETENPPIAAIGRQLRRRRRRLAAGTAGKGLRKQLKRFRRQMREARQRVNRWQLAADEFDALAGGFNQTFCSAWDAMMRAYRDPTAENFHEWRKHVKYHGYHCRLVRGVWPAVMDACRDAADKLGEWLGEDHDLAMIRQCLLQAPDEFGKLSAVNALVELIDRRRGQLHALAQPVGFRLFAHDPAAVTQWLADCWSIWRIGTTAARSAEPPLTLVH